MRKANLVIGLKTLAYLGLMQFKNNLKLTFTKPLVIIGEVLKLLSPVIIFIWLPQIVNNKIAKERLWSFHLPVNMIGAVIMLLLMFVCFAILKKAVTDYYPTQYSAADVNFLFTSPISSRLIYAWSITKQIGIALFGSIFMSLPLFLMLSAFKITANAGEIAFALAGMTVFIIIVQTLRFFLYSVSKRFEMATIIKTLVFISFGLIAVYFLISLYGSKDLLQQAIVIVGGKYFERIPLIGWTKVLLLSPLMNTAPVLSLVKLVLFAAVMLFITIYLATDYYEEAIFATERIAKVRAAFAGNNMEEVQRLAAKKRIKEKERVRFDWNLKKAYAFLWKAIVVHKRKSRGIAAESAKYIFYASVGVIFGYVLRNHVYQDLIIFIVVLGMIFKKGNSPFLEGLEYELKKNYIFLLPGSFSDKMFAINIIPIVKLLARNLALIAPMALFLKVNIIQLSSLWAVLSALNLASLFTVAAIKVILPFGNNKNMLLMMLGNGVEILLELPAAGMGVLTYLLFKNMEAALLVFGFCGLLTVGGLLNISESLFSRLELKN